MNVYEQNTQSYHTSSPAHSPAPWGFWQCIRSIGIAASHVPPPEKLFVDAVRLEPRPEPVPVGGSHPVPTRVRGVHLKGEMSETDLAVARGTAAADS